MTTLTKEAVSEALLIPCAPCRRGDHRACEYPLAGSCFDQIKDAHAVALVKMFATAAHDHLLGKPEARGQLITAIGRAQSYGFVEAKA